MVPDTATIDDLIGAASTSDDNNLAIGAARLLCAIHCGLPELTEECWQKLIREGGVIYPVLGRAMRVEIDAGRPAESFKLSQLWKAPPFGRANLERLVEPELLRRSTPEAAVANSFVAVQAAVRDLFGRKGPQLLKLTNVVVEAFNEHQRALLDLAVTDPVAAFRLGAPVEPQDLVDALPEQGGAVGLVDFACHTEQGLLVHLVNREQAEVAVRPMLCQAFGIDNALNLSSVYRRFVLGREQGQDPEEALDYIAQILHDRLWCHVAKLAGQLGLSQLIVIPDAWTRSLPHHLAKVCGAEVVLPKDVETVACERLADLFPVEMASTVQMVAINQWQTRPRNVERIAILADPLGDLPAARRTAAWMRTRAAEATDEGSPALACFVGSEATSARLETALAESDLMIYAGHGDFVAGDVAQTHLALADGEWSLSRLRAATVAAGSVQVLAACEVGAKSTGETVAADALPGALVSAGSAAVLSALWAVEDLSFGYLTDRFLHHLSHPGYRPSAALFRAMNELRTWSRADVIGVLRARLEAMDEADAAAGALDEYAHLAESLAWFEDEAPDPPFASPLYWGAAVVFGGGWAWPAGALSGGAEAIFGEIERALQSPAAPLAITEGRLKKAWELTHEALKKAHGPSRIEPLRDWAEIELRRGNHRFATLLLTRSRLLAEVHGKDEARQALEARLAQIKAEV